MGTNDLNPSGLCLCGCGQKIRIALSNKNGWIKGQPIKYIHNHKPTGEKHANWKGGRVSYGNRPYVRVRVSRHYVSEHVFLAENALGKPLPPKAHVHHHTPEQLVICQDAAYHQLLHRRQRALKACGHANWNKCWICKKYDDPINLKSSKGGLSSYHSSCINGRKNRNLTSMPLNGEKGENNGN